MFDKILSDPTSIVAWVALLFLIVKDVFLWIKNKGIPKFEGIDDKLDQVLKRLDLIEVCIRSGRKKNEDVLKEFKEYEEIIENLTNLVQQLHQWHSVTNEEGVKIWYIRPSLERALESLKSAIDIQTSLTKELVMEIKNNSNTLYRLEDKIT